MAYVKLIECDGCNDYRHYSNSISTKVIAEDARMHGWSVGKLHLCPRCKVNKAIRQRLKENKQNKTEH